MVKANNRALEKALNLDQNLSKLKQSRLIEKMVEMKEQKHIQDLS